MISIYKCRRCLGGRFWIWFFPSSIPPISKLGKNLHSLNTWLSHTIFQSQITKRVRAFIGLHLYLLSGSIILDYQRISALYVPIKYSSYSTISYALKMTLHFDPFPEREWKIGFILLIHLFATCILVKTDANINQNASVPTIDSSGSHVLDFCPNKLLIMLS